MKTNTNEVRNNVKAYILASIYDSETIKKEYNGDTETDSDRLQFVYQCFKLEYWFTNNQIRHRGNEIDGFSHWLAGLPSCFSVEYYNSDIIQKAKEFNSYKNTSGMSKKQIQHYEERIVSNWFNFISLNFFRLLRKEVKK